MEVGLLVLLQGDSVREEEEELWLEMGDIKRATDE